MVYKQTGCRQLNKNYNKFLQIYFEVKIKSNQVNSKNLLIEIIKKIIKNSLLLNPH